MSTLTSTRADRFGSPPSTPTAAVSWRFVALASAGIFSLVTALNVSVPVLDHIYGKVYVASSHLITPTLMISGVLLVLTMVGLVTVGRLRPRDLGWESSKVGPGLALVAGTWIVMQLVEVAGALVTGAPPQLSPHWTAAGWATSVGVLLGMVLALAPAEETFFRGFLLPQLRIKFAHLKTPAAMAVVASQLLFALYHLPNLVMGNSGQVGTSPSEIAVQLGLDFLIGVVYAALYLLTGNLFLVIGIHALQNAGTSLVATPIDPHLVMFALAVVLLLLTFRRVRALL